MVGVKMTKNQTCPHIHNLHTTSCKYCGRPQCDRCGKEHEEQYIKKGNKEIEYSTEDYMW